MSVDEDDIPCFCGHSYFDHDDELWCEFCECDEYEPDPWA